MTTDTYGGPGGATGDGETDDYTAVAAVLAAAATDGKGVYVPAGTYLLGSTLSLPDSVNVRGVGDTSWLKGAIRPASSMSFTDLKMGAVGATWGVSACHDMSARNCIFVGGQVSNIPQGVIGFAAVLVHDILFEGCIVESTEGANWDGVSLVSFGTETRQIYNVTFDGCHVMSQGLIGIEINTSYNASFGDFDYPLQNINVINCIFEPQGGSGISFAVHNGFSGFPGTAWDSNGYSNLSGNWIKDAGTHPEYAVGTHGIEVVGAKYMTITNNIIEGSHVGAMMLMNAGMSAPLYTTSVYRSYNTISGNTFNGTDSANSFMYLHGGSNWSFSDNIVKTRSMETIVQNSSEVLFQNNDIRAVNADGSVRDSSYALHARATDLLEFIGNTFASKAYTTVLFHDWNSTPSTNNTVDGNTFIKGAGDHSTYCGSGSDCTETNSTYITAE